MRDFELMGGVDISWSWPELQATPAYVTRFCMDLLSIKRRIINEKTERARQRGGR